MATLRSKRYTCPHCGRIFGAVATARAKYVKCPDCGTRQNVQRPTVVAKSPKRTHKLRACPHCQYIWDSRAMSGGPSHCPSCAKPLAQKAKAGSMKTAVRKMAALNVLEFARWIPDVGMTYVDWLQEWRATGTRLKSQTYAIEVGTPVWRLIVVNCGDTVLDHPSNFATETKHEWFFHGGSVYQNGETVYVQLSETEPYNGTTEACTVVGFFVSVGALYTPETRKNSAARNGKRIVSETKFAKSKGNGSWTVILYDDGSKSCNCPSWIFHHDATHGCKHTEKV